MPGIYVYDVTTIYVLVKFVTRPYDGKKPFLDLCISCQRFLPRVPVGG